ncbi:MAG: DUF3048 domain-containing protein [Peptococcaceae bacterium]
MGSKKYYFVVGALICLGILSGVAGFIYIGDLLKPHQEEVQEEPQVEIPQVQQSEGTEEETEWAGLPRARNLAVVVDNDINARPQAGLEKADYIYELPIEGGTARFMAVFSRFSADLIGPIRSARDYTITIAKEYDPIFVHAGGSPQAFAMFHEIGNLNGLEGGVDRAFWRIDEREAPYNLYSDSKTLRRVAEQEGFREEGQLPDFTYLKPDEEFSGSPSEKITIDYGHEDFKAEFLYDQVTKRYLRFTGGVKHWNTAGDQLSTKNIIIQIVNTNVIDDEGRLQLDLLSTGRAVFFSEGQVTQGYWEKKQGNDPTKFYRSQNEEIALAEGNTWLNIVPMNAKIAY